MHYFQGSREHRPPLGASPNGLNHCLPLNKTGAHSTGERFRATMALFLSFSPIKCWSGETVVVQAEFSGPPDRLSCKIVSARV